MAFVHQIKFSELSSLLEYVSTTKLIDKREARFTKFFAELHKYRDEYKNRNPDQDSSSLPGMRLLLGQEDKERSYGLQGESLRQLYIKSLNLHKNSPESKKILQCNEDDLPNKIHEVMKSRDTKKESLTIYEVDQVLNAMSENQREADQENQLRRLMLGTSALDQKWLVKMILKRMNINFGTAKILKLFHPKAHELHKKYNHLTKVIELIESGQSDVTRVFEPIRSMLSQKVTSNSNKSFLMKELYQETKMDGERFQLHMKDGLFKYYSRDGHEFSFPLLALLVKFKAVAHSIILDGEMMVYDKAEKRYHTLGETTEDVKYLKDMNSNLRPCFIAFDVLLFNEKCYLNRPYSERKELLGQLFDDSEGVIVKTVPIKIRDVDHMASLFNKAIESDEEGIILKEAQSIYKPGERMGGWYKVKPDYFDGALVKDFDCIVIGGYYKNSYTKNYVQRYMLGAVEKAEDGTMNIYAIGEVYSGITVQERMKISDRLKPHALEHNREAEVEFDGGKIFFGSNKPHFWLPPNKSIVLECRVSELAKSNEQYSEYTFRFPRIAVVRTDKIWEESCTMKEFQEMCKGGDDGKVKKTVQRAANVQDLTLPKTRKKPVTTLASVMAEFSRPPNEFDDVEVVDQVLEGKEFCVMTTNLNLPTEDELRRMIIKHGGTITMHPRKGKTFAIIAGLMTKHVEGYKKDKHYNIIKADWLDKNFGGEMDKAHTEMPKIRPVIDLVWTTDAMKESLKNLYDEYGNSYTERFATLDDFKEFFKTVKPNKAVSDEQLRELDLELEAAGLKNKNFFRCISAAFLTLNNKNYIFEHSKEVLEHHAGKIKELKEAAIDDTINIIVDQREDIKGIMQQLDENGIQQTQLINFRWILDSSDAGKLLNKAKYVLPSV